MPKTLKWLKDCFGGQMVSQKLPKPENTDAGIMVVGIITGIHIDDTVIKDGKVDVTAIQPLARLGYMDYARIDDVFVMPRPAVK